MIDAEDAERTALAEAAANRAILKRLAELSWPPSHPYRRAMRELLAADLTKLTPLQAHQMRKIAWAYRRKLPAHLRPKVNPDDPIVREMAARQ